jgi:hypothetical protein
MGRTTGHGLPGHLPGGPALGGCAQRPHELARGQKAGAEVSEHSLLAWSLYCHRESTLLPGPIAHNRTAGRLSLLASNDPDLRPCGLRLEDRCLPFPRQVLEALGVEQRLVELAAFPGVPSPLAALRPQGRAARGDDAKAALRHAHAWTADDAERVAGQHREGGQFRWTATAEGMTVLSQFINIGA